MKLFTLLDKRLKEHVSITHTVYNIKECILVNNWEATCNNELTDMNLTI